MGSQSQAQLNAHVSCNPRAAFFCKRICYIGKEALEREAL